LGLGRADEEVVAGADVGFAGRRTGEGAQVASGGFAGLVGPQAVCSEGG